MEVITGAGQEDTALFTIVPPSDSSSSSSGGSIDFSLGEVDTSGIDTSGDERDDDDDGDEQEVTITNTASKWNDTALLSPASCPSFMVGTSTNPSLIPLPVHAVVLPEQLFSPHHPSSPWSSSDSTSEAEQRQNNQQEQSCGRSSGSIDEDLMSIEDMDQDLIEEDPADQEEDDGDRTGNNKSGVSRRRNNDDNNNNTKKGCCSSSIKRFCSLMVGRDTDKKKGVMKTKGGSRIPPLEESIKFSLRYCFSVTVASIFCLGPPIDNPWTRATWIYITAGVVSWQPNYDLSAVLSCTRDQSLAVILASINGLLMGFLSMTITDLDSRDIFLGVVVMIHGFLYPYVSDRLGNRGNRTVMLISGSFGIVLLAFHGETPDDDPWKLGLYRLADIVIGCAVAAVSAIIVFPTSTYSQVIKKTKWDVQETGKSINVILCQATAVFTQEKKLPGLVDILKDGKQDEAHKLYATNADRYTTFHKHFMQLKYDPWFRLGFTKEEQEEFRDYSAVVISRTFRVQLNAILIDSVVRGDVDFGYAVPSSTLNLLKSIGQDCERALDSDRDYADRKQSVKRLVRQHLVDIRSAVATLMSESPASAPQINFTDLSRHLMSDNCGLLTPVHTKGQQVPVFFLILVESLILRVAKLYCVLFEDKQGKNTKYRTKSSSSPQQQPKADVLNYDDDDDLVSC